MGFDPTETKQELEELASYGLAFTFAVCVSGALGFDLWVAVALVLLYLKPWKAANRLLYRKASIYLGIVAMLFLGLVAHSRDYTQGVSAGFTAASIHR